MQFIGCKIMHFEIVIMCLVSVASANIIYTTYKLTYGNGSSNRIAYLHKGSLDAKSVGVRISETNPEVYELLDHAWMENRAYESGYSYYEKFVVDEVFTEQPQKLMESGVHYVWNITGPLPIGTKINILYTPQPDVNGYINIYGDSNGNVIYFHMDTRAHQIVYDQFKGYWLFAGCNYYPVEDKSAEILDLGLDINENTIHMSLNGSYSCDITQEALGDIQTYLYITQVTLYRIRYERPM